MLHVETLVEPTFGENTYVVFESPGGACWVVDPGFPPQPRNVARCIEHFEVRPAAIVLTHCHPDHIAGVDDVCSLAAEAELIVPAGETDLLTDPRANLSLSMGVPVIVRRSPDRLIHPGQTLRLEETEWAVLDLAGHSPAGIGLYCAAEGLVFVGDALFAGSIGRTDFPHSNHARLMESLRRLAALPETTRVFSGHGPVTTIGRERKSNPFLADIAP